MKLSNNRVHRTGSIEITVQSYFQRECQVILFIYLLYFILYFYYLFYLSEGFQ